MNLPRRHAWPVVVLTIVGCLLAMVAVVAVWARQQVLNTDRYLATVVPLASDPVIQDEVATKVAAAINARLDGEAIARQYLPTRAAPLAAPIGAALAGLVERTTSELVHSDQFPELWERINRVGHEELVRLLTGDDEGGDALEVTSGQLVLDLGVVVEAVEERLAQAGLQVVSQLPPINLVVEIADADGLESAQQAVVWLNRLAWVLPVLALLLLALAVVLARDRSRQAVRVLLGVSVAMVAIRALIDAGAEVAARNVPESVASPAAVDAYYGHLVRLLDRGADIAAWVFAIAGVLLVALRAVRARAKAGAAWRTAAEALPFAAVFLVLLTSAPPGWLAVVLVLTIIGVVLLRRQAERAGGPGIDVVAPAT